MSGFITLHREATEHPLFAGDSARFGAWVWMVARACWKPTAFDVNGAIITLQRGQFVASRSQMAKAWGWSESAVERFLTRLKTEQMIERETGQGRSIITICNYAKYQDVSDEAGQATGQETGQRPDSDRTAKEQGNKETREPNGSQYRGKLPLEPISGPENPPKPAKRKTSAKAEPITVPDWVPRDEWQAFIEMRKRKGSPPTDRAVHLLIGKLDALSQQGHPPGAVLDQSTIKNWTDLYPLKDTYHGNQHQSGFSPAGHRGQRSRDGRSAATDDMLEQAELRYAARPAG